MNNKVIMATLAGGIAFFFIGWLVYGILLQDFMASAMNQCSARKMEEMVWWTLIASNLVWAYFLAYVFDRTGVSGLSGGLQNGAVLGLLTALGFDLGLFAMSTLYLSLQGLIVDVVASTLMSSLTGGLIGWMLGRGKVEEG